MHAIMLEQPLEDPPPGVHGLHAQQRLASLRPEIFQEKVLFKQRVFEATSCMYLFRQQMCRCGQNELYCKSMRCTAVQHALCNTHVLFYYSIPLCRSMVNIKHVSRLQIRCGCCSHLASMVKVSRAEEHGQGISFSPKMRVLDLLHQPALAHACIPFNEDAPALCSLHQTLNSPTDLHSHSVCLSTRAANESEICKAVSGLGVSAFKWYRLTRDETVTSASAISAPMIGLCLAGAAYKGSLEFETSRSCCSDMDAMSNSCTLGTAMKTSSGKALPFTYCRDTRHQ